MQYTNEGAAMPRPTISSQYDFDSSHWWFTRDSKLPRDTFDRPLSERLADHAAVTTVAALIVTIILCILL